MGFWRNVDYQLKYLGITRKEFAFDLGLNKQTVDRSILRDSEPKLSDGLKIAAYLKVSPESLLDKPIVINPSKKGDSKNDIEKEIHLYKKHFNLISVYDTLNEDDQISIKKMTQFMAEKNNSYNKKNK